MNIVLIIQILIGLIAAFAIYNLMHYLFVTRPSKKRLLAAQRVVNQAVMAALQALVKDGKVSQLNEEELHSEMIAHIWGRGVMAFEYHIPVDRVRVSIPDLRDVLSAALSDYSQKNHIRAQEKGKSAFVITDMWQLDDRLHFDVAYLVNLTTVEYLDDLKRLH
ncbi:hypothetical protein HMPREF9103_00349 [Lentilactobacillus parafarraginis F0439]|uniref:Uncharacterized protein n=1 Tax=Lentilactobacillus parafarraginis F0439 TaxID=797515 RepID=G9ZKV1_9LACO|nr:DUF1471 domain-containing protein [Lentilactobacillus parafarraginis]EHM00710.1 hypothetical protein HMPREF9103_00349 [Lentilactobacillus parafarraginis F0439]